MFQDKDFGGGGVLVVVHDACESLQCFYCVMYSTKEEHANRSVPRVDVYRTIPVTDKKLKECLDKGVLGRDDVYAKPQTNCGEVW